MRTLLAALAIAMMVSGPAMGQEVSEENKAKSKELFTKGIELFKNGKHAQALESFKASYEARPHWKLHLNIGLCYKELSMYTEAKAELQLFIDEGKDQVDKASLETVNNELEALAGIIAVLDIEVTNEGAVIKLDGKEEGVAPLTEPLDVNPGSHVLDVQLENHKPYHEEFLLSKGEKKEISVTLERVVVEVGSVTGPAPVEEEATRGKGAPAFWAMGALALALGGGAIATGVLALQKKQDLDKLDKDQDDLYASGGYSEDVHRDYLKERRGIQDDGKLFGYLTTGLMAGAGAALVATVVAGALTHPFAPKGEEQEPEAAPAPVAFQIAPVPTSDGALLVVAGTF